LVAKIVAEANQEGVSLSEVERKMLYFSETDWTLADVETVSEAFTRDYDHDVYEKKITSLIHNARKRARKEDRQEFDAWSDAIRVLSKEDHYLTVMIDEDDTSIDWLGLSAFGFLIIGGLAVPILLSTLLKSVLPRFGVRATRESLGFVLWLITAAVAVIGTLWYHFLGWQRGSDFIARVKGRLLRVFHRSI